MLCNGRRNAFMLARAPVAACAGEVDSKGKPARMAVRRAHGHCPCLSGTSPPPAELRRKANTMRCANPQCHQEAHSLQEGTLRLLELAVPPEERIVRSETGFPVVVVPSRYFWLCPECSRVYSIKRWTPAGLILDPRSSQEGEKSVLVKLPPSRSVSRSRMQASFERVA